MKKQHFLFSFAVYVVLFGTLLGVSTQQVLAYVAADFTNEMNGRSAAYAGATNIKLGEFTGPTPATDTLVHNGATAVIAAGNALTAFASSERYLDTNNDAGFDSGEAVVSSANSTLDATDTVVTGATGILTAVGTSEAEGEIVYLDNDTDSSYDAGEGVSRIVVSGTDAALTSGDVFETFPLADDLDETSVMYMRSGASEGFDYDAPYAIIQYEVSGDDNARDFSVLRGGSVGFTTFESVDNVCLSDADVNGSYSFGEAFWYDIAGTCASFTTGVDIALSSDGVIGAPHMNITAMDVNLLPMSFTVGYSDADADGAFDCTRGGICEQMMYIAGSLLYPTGTALTPGSMIGLVNYNKDDLTDGAAAIAEAPGNINADPDVINFVYLDKALAADGVNNRYLYKDTNNDNVYDAEEDIIEATGTGTSAGTTVRYFPSGRAFADIVIDNNVFDGGEPIFISADTNLDAGVLSGAGTDDLVVASGSGFADAFAATDKYHDHNTSGAYADGDDIVSDIDGSGYYNADDLLTIQFANSVTDHPIGDDDLDNMYLYKRVGGSCVGSGTDTLLGSIATTPFFDTNITVTDSVFTSATNYCIYADFLAGADAGEYLTFELSQNGADYASTGTSPSNAVVDFSQGDQYFMTMSRFMSATLEATSLVAGATTSYTTTFTTSAELNSGDVIRVVFDADNDISGASISCTDDGVASAGTSSIGAPIVTHTLSTTISAGSDVECVVTGVENPSAGVYGDFQVYTARDVDTGAIVGADVDTTLDPITFTPAPTPSGRGRSAGSSVPAPGVVVTSPAQGATIEDPLRITWNSTGRSVTDANLLYTVGGERYYIARNVTNSGAYTWDIPAHLSGKELTITVELTDLATVITSSSVNVTVEGEALPEDETPRSADTWEIPDLSAHLVKVATSPTVFYLGPDKLLRAFFNEALFKTWELTFGDIRTISFDELSQYQLGSGMVPLPGTVLIKSPIDAKVYVLEPNDLNPAQPILHWITSEEVALAYFGADWASKIIDVTPSIIVMSIHGEDLDDPLNPPWYIGLYK